MIDFVNVHTVLDTEAAAGHLSAGEAADIFTVARQGIQHLTGNHDVDGYPFLTAEVETNSK
jgi:hypothetical protein